MDNIFYLKDQAITSSLSENSTLEHCMTFLQQWSSGQESFTIHTSGSTSTPKPIEISRNQMEASAKMTAQALSLDRADNALVCLNTSFIAGKMMLVRGLVCDLNLYITEPSSNPLLNLADNLHIDFIAVVPLQLETMIEAGEQCLNQLNQMKAIIVGGAPIYHVLAEKIKKLKSPVYATYGMTETVSHIALKRLNGIEQSDYFQVFNGVEIGQNDRGCLTINSFLTNHQTIITNDIVNIIDSHNFEWLGRVDQVINSGGLKIHPEQLEDQIKSILNKQRIYCHLIIAGITDRSFGEKVVLILETTEMTSNTLEDLKRVLKNELPTYQVPKEIYCLEHFIYTESGKVKRNETISFIS